MKSESGFSIAIASQPFKYIKYYIFVFSQVISMICIRCSEYRSNEMYLNPNKNKMHIFSVGKYVLIGEAVKENIWKNTRHCHNLPCYQRQAVSIDSNNRCRTSQANATNNYYRRSQHRCLTLTRKKIAGRIGMKKKSSKLF